MIQLQSQKNDALSCSALVFKYQAEDTHQSTIWFKAYQRWAGTGKWEKKCSSVYFAWSSPAANFGTYAYIPSVAAGLGERSLHSEQLILDLFAVLWNGQEWNDVFLWTPTSQQHLESARDAICCVTGHSAVLITLRDRIKTSLSNVVSWRTSTSRSWTWNVETASGSLWKPKRALDAIKGETKFLTHLAVQRQDVSWSQRPSQKQCRQW